MAKEVSLHKVPLKAVTLHGKFLAVFSNARCIHPAMSIPAVIQQSCHLFRSMRIHGLFVRIRGE